MYVSKMPLFLYNLNEVQGTKEKIFEEYVRYFEKIFDISNTEIRQIIKK